jgi:hypothetical protein
LPRLEFGARSRGAWHDDGPAADGGAGLGTHEAEQFRRLEAGFDIPDRGGLLVGLSIVTPAIIEHGTPAQRAELVGPLLRGRPPKGSSVPRPETVPKPE